MRFQIIKSSTGDAYHPQPKQQPVQKVGPPATTKQETIKMEQLKEENKQPEKHIHVLLEDAYKRRGITTIEQDETLLVKNAKERQKQFEEGKGNEHR